MTKIILNTLTGLLFMLLTGSFVQADPPIWDNDFGADTGLQDDDEFISVTLGFNFPFAGVTYDTIGINTNGGIALGNAGVYVVEGLFEFDIWDVNFFELDFNNIGNPMIGPFISDLDNSSVGIIYFKTDANSATITWEGVATFQTGGAPFITFQLTLAADGTITFGYNGIFGDLINDLDQGIVVGITDGLGSIPVGSSDLSDVSVSTEPLVYEIWCYDENPGTVSPRCFESPTIRPDNTGFDLDQTNVVFTPNNLGGFDVSNGVVPEPVPEPEPNPVEEVIAAAAPGGGGGCAVVPNTEFDPLLLLMLLVSGFYVVVRARSKVYE